MKCQLASIGVLLVVLATASQADKDCYYSGYGDLYTGTESQTSDGFVCQRWDSQEPHQHSYSQSSIFMDGISHNYCRTKLGEDYKPWCYTVDSNEIWGYCQVKECNQCLDKDDWCALFLRGEGKESYCQHPWARANCAASCEASIATTCAKTDSSLRREMAILHGDIQVLCDTETDGGDWVIFQQKRYKSDVNFYRDWDAYKSGFGDLTTTGKFWLGLDNIHSLCGKVEDNCELRIDMKSGGSSFYVTYETFYIGPESDNYRLAVSGYNGDAGDTLSYVNGMQFSTFDRDNDEVAYDCASDYMSGWWFGDCENEPDLNGALFWWSEKILYIMRSEMKFRRRPTI